MLAAICRIQWKVSATAVLLLAVGAFVVPLLAVQQAGFTVGDRRGWDLIVMLNSVESAGMLFPILAIIAGLALAVGAWSADHQGDHVYALTLPVPRWYYVLLRFAAGAVLIVPLTAAAGLGCAIAIGSVEVPPALHTYGGAVTLRFGLAVLVSYAAMFALAAGTKRTAALVIGAVVGAFLLGEMLVMIGLGHGLVPYLLEGIFTRFGPFEILLGPWALISV